MSDRAMGNVIVYDIPEPERAAAYAVLTSNDTWLEDIPEAIAKLPQIFGSVVYTVGEVSLNFNETFSRELAEAAPGASFEVWVDPKYEYHGALTRYAPELEFFEAPCDADGEPILLSQDTATVLAEVEAAIGDEMLFAHDVLERVRAAFDREIGKAWSDRFAAFTTVQP